MGAGRDEIPPRTHAPAVRVWTPVGWVEPLNRLRTETRADGARTGDPGGRSRRSARENWDEQDGPARFGCGLCAHNPQVAGSSPVPATTKQQLRGPFPLGEG